MLCNVQGPSYMHVLCYLVIEQQRISGLDNKYELCPILSYYTYLILYFAAAAELERNLKGGRTNFDNTCRYKNLAIYTNFLSIMLICTS